MLSIKRSDAEIVNAVADAFNQSLLIPHEGIRITAADGTVWLEGTVTWEFERMAAIDRALGVPGVGAVYNRLDVVSPPPRVRALLTAPHALDGLPTMPELARA